MPKRTSYINPEFQTEHVSFFHTLETCPTGNLISAGIGRSLHTSEWPDTRQPYSYPYYTLNAMLKGSRGAYRNVLGFECQLEYGDFIFTFPHIKHVYGPGSKDLWNELMVSYRGGVFDIYHRQKYFCPEQPVWHLEHPEPWFADLQKLLHNYHPTNQTMMAAQTMRFLALVLEMKNAAISKTTGRAETDWFEQACLMLMANTHEIDLPRIARKLGMSYSSFRFHFAQRAGMPPYQYRDKKRIEAACASLTQNPSKLLKEIAFSLGYSRTDHFARQFKKHTGMLPGEYRRHHKERAIRSLSEDQ